MIAEHARALEEAKVIRNEEGKQLLHVFYFARVNVVRLLVTTSSVDKLRIEVFTRRRYPVVVIKAPPHC